MKKLTTIATMCLLVLMLSFSQAVEITSQDGMMKDNMKETRNQNVMKKDDMMDKSDSMK